MLCLIGFSQQGCDLFFGVLDILEGEVGSDLEVLAVCVDCVIRLHVHLNLCGLVAVG